MSADSQTDDGIEWYAGLINAAREYTSTAIETLAAVMQDNETCAKDKIMAVKMFIQLTTSKDALALKDVRWETMNEAQQITHLRKALKTLEDRNLEFH